MISAHTIAAEVVIGPDIVPLAVTDAKVTLDEGWSPYVQAELECALPADVESIDPRSGAPRVRLRLWQRFGESDPISVLSAAWAGLTLADLTAALAGTFLSGLSATYGRPYNAFGMRPSTSRLLDLSLRARETDHAAASMHLGLSSDEGMAQDYALVATSPASPGSTSVRAICSWALAYIGAALTAGTVDGEVEAEAVSWAPGQSLWDYLYPLVNAAGLRLWCDEHRDWHLGTPEDGTAGGLVLSAEQSVTRADQTIDRDGRWCDAVVVKYQWTDGSNVQHTVYDTATTPGYTKTKTVTYGRPYPGPGAAAALLAREQGRGRELGMDAVSDYRAAPGQALTATLPDIPIQTGIVSSVTWRLPDDEMTVTSRALIDTPVTSWLFTPAGIAWEDVDPGVDWTEYEVEA